MCICATVATRNDTSKKKRMAIVKNNQQIWMDKRIKFYLNARRTNPSNRTIDIAFKDIMGNFYDRKNTLHAQCIIIFPTVLFVVFLKLNERMQHFHFPFVCCFVFALFYDGTCWVVELDLFFFFFFFSKHLYL